MDKLCRACLTTGESFNYILFENVSPDLYSFCTSIEILQDEKLPKTLCNNCYELLTKYTDFKHTCIRSQNTLLDIRSNVKYESEGESKILKENVDNKKNFQYEFTNVTVKIEDDAQDNDELLAAVVFPELMTDNKVVKIVKRKKKKLGKLKQLKIRVKEKAKHFMYRCDLCDKKFRYSERFEAHKLEHEGKMAPKRCIPCNKTFMTWSGLKRHNDSEHTIVNLESLKCSTCGKVFKSQQTLRMHEKNHGERKLCVCDVCGRGFTSAYILRTHLETHKVNRERSYACEHCGKKFFTNTILLSHVSRRHSGRRFVCQICNYPFTDKYNLAKHLLIHDGKKLYKCDICDKSYAKHASLVEHKRTHSGERPFACSYCPKSFLSKRRLNDHHNIHTGVKPHVCGVCGHGFTQRGTLKRHMKVHDRIVPILN